MCETSENEFINAHIDALKEDIHFFSNKCKPDREVWVVKHFLSQLRIKFSNQDICASTDEPIDVEYHDAKFQIKEIMEKNRRRGSEYKESLRKAEVATSASDLLEHYSPKKVSCADVVTIVADNASKWQRKYGPSECLSTDLLFYFNYMDVNVVGSKVPEIDICLPKMVAWRSVSVCTNDCALVLHVSENAPVFLRKAKGKVYRNRSNLFD